MGYSFHSRVRWSETGEDGFLTLPGILDYFQDCCTFQTDDIRQGMKDLIKRDRFWVLSSWQVIVRRYPGQGELIKVTTLPYSLKGFTGLRNFLLETEEGEKLACADSRFTFLNSRTGHPTRLTEEDLEGYVLDERLDMEYADRKIRLPAQMERKDPFEIRKHHLDSNHHVNNCQYVRMAMEYLPEGAAVVKMRAEYKKQARLGDEIHPLTGTAENLMTVSLSDKTGDPYAVVELKLY